MRQHTFIGLAVAVLVAAGCSLVPEPREFGTEPAPAPTQVTAFDDTLTAKLPDIPPLHKVKEQAVDGDDITVAAPLNSMDDAWHAYLRRLNDGRMDAHPTQLEAVELQAEQQFGSVCRLEPNHRYPQEVIQPMHCPDFVLGDDTPAFMVLPAGFTDKLRDFGANTDEMSAWMLASVLAGLTYAVHLRHEMKVAGVMWPNGETFDYCVAGISLRAVFPGQPKELEGQAVSAILAMLDQLTHRTEVVAQRLGNLTVGFKSGRLEECVA